MSLTFPVDAKLKDGSPVQLVLAGNPDIEPLRSLYRYAKQLGYRSVIFNLVFSENVIARRLWEKLGFKALGVIPGAVRKNDGHIGIR